MTSYHYKPFTKGLLKLIQQHYDKFEWATFQTPHGELHYYRTKIDGLEIRIGYDYTADLYYAFIEKIGRVAVTTPRRWLPVVHCQRCYNLIRLYGKENRIRKVSEEQN